MLDSSGHAKVETTISNHGLGIDSKLRLLQLKEKQIKEDFEESMTEFEELQINTCHLNLVEDSLVLKESYKYNINHFGEMTNEYILLPTVLNKLHIPKLKRNQKRQSNIYFPRPFRNISSVTLNIPNGYEPISIPESIIESNDKYLSLIHI